MRTANDVNIKDLHSLYVEKGGKLSSAQASKIFYTFFSKIAEKCINDNFEFRFPRKMGFVSVKKHKRKVKFAEVNGYKFFNIPVDWPATMKLRASDPEAKDKKKVVYMNNDHTKGFIMQFCWDKNTCAIKNKTGYYFKASRYNNRKLAKAIKNGEFRDFFMK